MTRSRILGAAIPTILLMSWLKTSGADWTVDTDYSDWTISAYAGLSTNYIYRGLSFTDNKVTPRANLFIGHQIGAFLNIWVSRDDISGLLGQPRGLDTEFEFNLGYGGSITDHWTFSISHAWLEYQKNHQPRNHDYREIRLNINYEDWVTFFAAHTKSIWNTGDDLTTFSMTGRYAFPFAVLAEAEVGWLDFAFPRRTSLPYFRVSVGRQIYSGLYGSVEFQYSDVKDNEVFNSERTGSQWAATLNYHF